MSRPSARRSFLELAFSPSVVRRACGYAVVVGAVLITINHGDALLEGQIDGTRILKMLLTVCVPFVVSTLSSVGALRRRDSEDP
ncbi:MAG: nitrate/nitrite transporter NrtS [Acidobacteria bacterium]|nr:nitrate/nitrite transporter NrtS [Acidobacteriota bacterium]